MEHTIPLTSLARPLGIADQDYLIALNIANKFKLTVKQVVDLRIKVAKSSTWIKFKSICNDAFDMTGDEMTSLEFGNFLITSHKL